MASNEDIKRFLHYISQLESSGGKHLDHKTVKKGPLKGETAEGPHALMPSTKEELLRRFPSSLQEDSNPQEFDNKLAEYVLNRAKGDETVAAGLWRHGHNRPEDRFDKLRETDYAQAYDDMRSQVPYALDANPYQQERASGLEEKSKFPQLGKIFKKP